MRDNCANENFWDRRRTSRFSSRFILRRRCRLQIVMAEQMQNAVDNVTDNFRLPAVLKSFRLQDGLVHADEQFAVQVLIPASAFPFPVPDGQT